MSAVDDLAEALLKGIGENNGAQAVTQWIDTGFPPLNKILSGRYDGGLPFGRMVEMFGESSTGKTALATQWMVNAQRMGGVAGFIDWERSFDVRLAEGFGLTTTRPHWIYAKPKTWEEGNMIAGRACQLIRASKAISKDAPILFVLDSIAAALPKSVSEKELDELSMNDTTALARVTSTTLKSMSHFCEEFNATFLYLNQMRLKPGVVYGDPRTTPGGKAMEFYASGRLALGRQKIMEQVDGEKQFVGQQISIQCVKSKFTKPFQETSLRMAFDEVGAARFDVVSSLLEYLIEKKLVTYSKPRVTWTDGKQYFAKALAAKITEEGLMSELVAMLPK
jgi:protein RecA